MPATQTRRKRRRQTPPQKKTKIRKPQLRRKKLQVTRGRKERQKPAVRRVRRGRGLKRPHDLYVSKLLQQLHHDKVPISAKAKGVMISYVRRIYKKVSSAAECHRKNTSHCVIGSKQLQSALHRVVPRKMGRQLEIPLTSYS